MTTTKKQPTLRVVLRLPPKIADFIVRAQQIHDALAANTTTLPAPDPPLTKLQSDVDDLTSKEARAKSRVEGAVTDRDNAKAVVVADLQLERAYVEKVATANPTNASAIAQDASMALKKAPARNKPTLATKAGTVSGTVKLVAKATKGAKANEWQQSTDGGKTWTDLPKTTKSSTTVPNLTVGQIVQFRHRVFTKTGEADWDDPVSATVT